MSDSFQSNLPPHSVDFSLSDKDLYVVGIGASAGGLIALDELFDYLPVDSGAAFVVIQHLSPDFKSLMRELLRRHTKMAVHRVTEGMELEPNSVYLIPPGKNLILEANVLRLESQKRDKKEKYQLNFPIDKFLISLAENYRERSIGVILSGSGSDGTRGLKAIKAMGGVALVQEPLTAGFDSMPKSAISTGIVDRVLPVQELAQSILQCTISPLGSLDTNPEAKEKEFVNSVVLREIANILVNTENIDFSHYKPNTISRRIYRRCLINNLDSVSKYIELLKCSIEEREILCADLLIKVTSFFRDREAWLNLQREILPLIVEGANPHDELRFWVTACSTGEEAYSLAILIHEALLNVDKPLTVKIFATDIDKTALEIASSGIYPQSIANIITAERLQRYFIPQDSCYQVTRTIREMMIFSYHDLTKDAGFTRMNLVSCRNVLIYMQSDLQNTVIRNLHFALVNQGTLFLGEAETLGDFESEFKPINKKWKLYCKRRDVRLPMPVRANSLNASYRLKTNHKLAPEKYTKESIREQTLKRILQASDSIALAVNHQNKLLFVSGDAEPIFKTPDGEITNEITKIVVQPLQLPLNTALHRARKEKKSIFFQGIKLGNGHKVQQVSLQVIPPSVDSPQDDFLIVQIEPEKVIDQPLIAETFESDDAAQRRIAELERELQYTRENLQALVEELESSNEDQQASNEELTASNEELQSTNEELHSVNEELHTVNIEYQSKIQQLTELNDDIDNLLKSTEIGVIFLDSELRIRKFTPAATAAIALRYSDLERPLADLAFKIECPHLVDLLQQVLETRQPLELEVKLRQSASYFLMQIHLYQTDSKKNDGLVISFIKIDEIKKAQQALKERERSFQAIFNSMFQFIGLLSPEGILLEANQTALVFGGLTPEDVLNRPFWEAKWWKVSEATQQKLKKAIARAAQGEFIRYEVDVLGAADRVATIDFSIKPVKDETGKVVQLIPEGREISELKQAREELQQTNLELEQRVAQRTQSLADFSDRLRQMHRLAISNYQQLDDLFADYLQAGCQMLNMSTGIVSEVNDCIYEIVAVESPLNIEVGYKAPCVDTYCAEVLETAKTVIFEQVGTIKSMKEHPVYLNLKLESFIGTPILVDGNLYGTLNFSDTKPRQQGFTQEEIEILELMARDIGKFIASMKTQITLYQSETRFRNTFEQAAVGIAHVSPTGQFIQVNQRLCDIVGYENNILVDLTFQEITHPEDLDLDLEYVGQMLTGAISNYSMAKRYIHRNGSIVWVNITVSLVKNDLGEAKYFISVIEDISDRKQTEVALIESKLSKQKLQLVNEAKDDFIAHMSHELRTPLTSILGFSQLLQKESLPAQRLRYANIVYQSGEHLLALINDILDFSKITANQLKIESKDFALIPFLTQIITSLRIRARETGLKLQTSFPPNLPTNIYGDCNRLRQVLYNLLSNAIKFTPTGSVTLKVSFITESSAEAAATGKQENQLRFEVEDTGIGISSDKFADIFTPFEQLNNTIENQQGTGLGLTISQNILGLMGSQIQLESQVGRGSKFWFDLTLQESKAKAKVVPILSESHWQQPRHLKVPQKILVIDDNDHNRALLLAYLQPLGFIVAEANNGEVGVTVAKTFEPDAILTDLVMPIMDAREMINQIKSLPPLQHTPILMLSANSQLIFQPSEFICDDFLSKPFDLEQLLRLLENHLQLDWEVEEVVVEKDKLSTLNVPTQEELRHLLELVNCGDIQAVEAQINSLAELEVQYNAFAQEILQLTTSFQQNQLEAFIKNLIRE